MDNVSCEVSLKQYLRTYNVSASRVGYLLAAVLMPASTLLDWVVHPELTQRFLLIRIGVAALCLLMAQGVKRAAPKSEVGAFFVSAGPPLLCASAIQLMIEELEGYASPYYAGLNLCILSVGVLYTWRWTYSLTLSLGVIAIWLAPTIPKLFEANFGYAVFFNNTFFLCLTAVVTVASTQTRYSLARREYAARQGLAETSEELEGTLSKLQQLDRLKNEFFANISHELRTPLTLILAPVEDLLTRPQGQAVQSALEVVRKNAARLLRLIDDLLDLARVDAGGLRLHVSEVDAVDLCVRLTEKFQPTARVRGVELRLLTQGHMQSLHADPHRLEIVVTNLLANALKFTPQGGHVVLELSTNQEGLSVEVRDDGPGLTEEDKHRIFSRFYQVESSQTRKHGGAGIGLTLASELVRLHGGQLDVESELDKGSRFFFTLPWGDRHFSEETLERRVVHVEGHASRRAEDAVGASDVVAEQVAAAGLPAPKETPIFFERGRRARVLIAEDNPELRDLMMRILNGTFEVVAVSNGTEAWSVIEEQRPDLVLSDIMMPEMSGTELCRKIKSHPSLRTTPVILITARQGSDAAIEGYGAGAEDFVTKPFHPRLLLARVSAQLKLRALSLQLAAQSRLSTAATLAAGIAHEVKNPLNAILNAIAVIRKGTAKPEMERKLQSIVHDGAHRILHIVSALDEQVRPADGDEMLLCNARDGLDSALRLLEHRVGRTKILKEYRSQELINASPRALNQVFLNLLDNALRVEPSHIWVEVRAADEPGMLQIAIADDGPGVPPALREQIFDPFFTTRRVGEGTGLGLYMSRRIVREFGGDMWLRAREGGGAEFCIHLPAAEPSASVA